MSNQKLDRFKKPIHCPKCGGSKMVFYVWPLGWAMTEAFAIDTLGRDVDADFCKYDSFDMTRANTPFTDVPLDHFIHADPECEHVWRADIYIEAFVDSDVEVYKYLIRVGLSMEKALKVMDLHMERIGFRESVEDTAMRLLAAMVMDP